LNIHGSIIIIRFTTISELEFFLKMENANTATMELTNFLEKNQRPHIQIIALILKTTSCGTMWIILFYFINVQSQNSIDKINYFF
jgi:hypothetical protein